MFEVQTYTLWDGWINCWTVDLKPQLFETVEEAQAELDEFFKNAQNDMFFGYRRSEFRIRPVR